MVTTIGQILKQTTPQTNVAENAQTLERIIAIKANGTTEDIISLPVYVGEHGDLQGYGNVKLKKIITKQREADKALSDAFKRIALFESAIYIAGRYVTELGEDPATKDVNAQLLQAMTSLVRSRDYRQGYLAISNAYEGLKERKKPLQVFGRASSSYLFSLQDVLNFCKPENYQGVMSVGFAGRSIQFLVYEFGQYEEEAKRDPRFAEFSKKWPHLIRPSVGCIRLQSPEDISYATEILDKLERGRQTIDPDTVSLGGRTPSEYFKIILKQD